MTTSDTTLLRYQESARQYQTPRFSCAFTISGDNIKSCEITISGPDNVRLHAFGTRLQYQAPTMSDPTLSRNYNIKPRQCQTPRFSRETTISGPEHETYNFRPHAFRGKLQYQSPTMSDPTLFVRDYNIRPRQCQTPRFRATTISSPDNVKPHAFR